MICVSLMPRSTDDALAALSRLASVLSSFSSVQSAIRNPKSEISVELRLDAIQTPDLARLLARPPCPLIATCRPKREGGLYDGPEQPRLELLREAARLGADYIDVEHDAFQALGPVAPAKRIVSYHNFKETPPDLDAIHARLARLGADVVKIAVTANHILDTVPVLRLLRAARTPTIALSMGERGLLTRILAPKFGAFLTYASFDSQEGSPPPAPVCHGRPCPAVPPPGSPPPARRSTPGDESRRSRDESPGRPQSEAGPGQLSLSEMLDLYRVHRIGRATRVFGVIADPVAHSLSPRIHNAAFASLGLDAVYLPFWVEGDPAAFVRAFREFGFDGYSVTIPHKQKVMEAMDEISPLARRVGAMNTVVRRPDGSLFGTNTDISAGLASIEAVVGKGWLLGKRALLLGAGGLGRALAFALADAGTILTITDLDITRSESLAREVGSVAVQSAIRNFTRRSLGEGGPKSAMAFDVVLNCSPVGMHPDVDASPVPAEMLRKDMVVYDAVYNPAETKLLRDARAAGCRTVAGIDHFVRQAVEQFELWTGQSAPVQMMRETVLSALATA
ncbi:MAG: shikimate dehydrogenase [Planctomycetota bacterium]|nr:shikimate dehydrogenase [Planctomycetota bacterium]